MRKPVDEYLEKASQLNKVETERLLARMRSKLMRRLENKKMNVQEAVAIQLEIEDEELQEWRTRMTEIRKKSKNK
jgi:N-acyl-L-homoserine lactone synthetase